MSLKEISMGKKLTIFLIDGLATGPRTIEIGNWSGKAIYSQRSTLPKILDREEFDRPGVYILKSMPNSDNFNERVYWRGGKSKKENEATSC